jgi:hypothetical protein
LPDVKKKEITPQIIKATGRGILLHPGRESAFRAAGIVKSSFRGRWRCISARYAQHPYKRISTGCLIKNDHTTAINAC